jgi:hypothetical protein
VRAHGLAERVIVGELGLVECLHIQLDEPGALVLGDHQMPVDVDQVLKAKLAGEPVRAPEGLRREPGEMLDVFRLADAEEGLQQRIGSTLT